MHVLRDGDEPSGGASAGAGANDLHGEGAPPVRSCLLCRRPLDVETDPLSSDCGGDCWGCVGEIEYNHGIGYPPSVAKVKDEIRSGLRERNGNAKSYPCPKDIPSRARTE